MGTLKAILTALRRERARLFAQHAPTSMAVFGSTAWGRTGLIATWTSWWSSIPASLFEPKSCAYLLSMREFATIGVR